MTSICGNSFLVGAIALVAAGSVPSQFGYTVQYSALGILGWAVWYMLARAFPRQLRAQKEERKVLIDAQLNAQENMRKEFQNALETILEIVKASSES